MIINFRKLLLLKGMQSDAHMHCASRIQCTSLDGGYPGLLLLSRLLLLRYVHARMFLYQGKWAGNCRPSVMVSNTLQLYVVLIRFTWGRSGAYLKNCRETALVGQAKDAALARNFWDETARQVAQARQEKKVGSVGP